MEFARILVALDRSPQADVVFQKALLLAKRESAALKIFHCVNIPPLAMGSSLDFYGEGTGVSVTFQQEQLQATIQDVQGWLQGYLQQAMALNVPAEIECQVGEAGFWIRELVSRWNADLLVLGRRGRSELATLILGSVSNYAVHHVECSVLIVQGK